MLQVIRCAVERIDDPRPPAGALETHTAFFAEDRVVRAVFANQGDDRGFAFAVRARHPVIARFQVGVFFSELLPMRQQNGRAEARRVACKLNIIFPGGHRTNSMAANWAMLEAIHASPYDLALSRWAPHRRRRHGRGLSRRRRDPQPQSGAETPARALHA